VAFARVASTIARHFLETLARVAGLVTGLKKSEWTALVEMQNLFRPQFMNF